MKARLPVYGFHLVSGLSVCLLSFPEDVDEVRVIVGHFGGISLRHLVIPSNLSVLDADELYSEENNTGIRLSLLSLQKR